MSAGIRFGYRNLEHTPEATFVVKQLPSVPTIVTRVWPRT